ncbi:hypothetical protein M8Z33_32275 [Streptomyces sp. ZAF1911]|uniref:hypothetical protein n=1 Tax=Streptomyces sp. ZAF1911 TaxID=2944129 RepID=UPI00237B4C8F|nr:hypothetical protein [Streptomyces sp. ZAF1911]MDD9381248.1 hypothetical protein [Streptomyces sp. ZAF1911]
MFNAALTFAISLVAAVGMLVDDRQLLGESVWFKPMKFGFAFGVYGVTLAWLLSRLTKGRRLGWWTGSLIAGAGVIDVCAVAYAAAHGTYSHFNENTDAVARNVGTAFSIGVMPLLAATLVIAVLVLFQSDEDLALRIALGAGLALAAAGMAVAVWLNTLAAEPRTVADAAGNPVVLSGGRGIGDPDGHGMPLTGWSTTGGDLRVPHLVGMHAIHVLLLLVALMHLSGTRLHRPLGHRVRTRLVGGFALWYAGLFAVLTWQARRGQSVAHPDQHTLVALAAVTLLALAVTSLGLAAVRRPKRARAVW